MTASTSLIFGKDDRGVPVRLAITDTGLTDGSGNPLYLLNTADTLKPVVSATYAPSTYKDAGTVTKALIKATPGNVYALRVTNANAAARYLQLHNKITIPLAGETAQLYFLIPGGSAAQPGILELSTEFLSPSEYFAAGIGFAISTTATTFTDAATAAEHNTLVRYA